MNYDFDRVVDRRNTYCMKYDGMDDSFGCCNDVMPLWIADMDFEVCPAISEALARRIDHKVYGYNMVPDSYWQSIINWAGKRHGFHFSKEEVCYVPGVVRGIGYAINHFTRRGDKILIQPPVYHPFKKVIEGNGRIVVNNPLKCTCSNMDMDFDDLQRKIADEKPKMMILCNPHNPGGRIWDKETLAKVAHICKEAGMIVVSDEIHADVELFGNRYTPFATASKEAEEISVVFSAPSKTFNIPGLVSSWCVVKNPRLRTDFFHWLEINEFSAPTMFVTIATEAAYNHGEEWLDELLHYIEGNILFVENYLKEHLPKIRTMRPQASFLMWLDCSDLGMDSSHLGQFFVEKAHLALNNGEMFGCGGECHMRLNVGCPRSVLAQSLDRLREAVLAL